MFAVGKIATTHTQWTVGEFTYAYMRISQAINRKDYIISHASQHRFALYLPTAKIPLNLAYSEPVPVRIIVDHPMDLTPQEMTAIGFGVVAKTIFIEASREVAARCPRRASCMCRLEEGWRSRCGTGPGQQEFLVEGMIAAS